MKAVRAFGRETRASFYTPLKGYRNAARYERILSVAADAYERKTGRDFYKALDKHSLSEQEKSDIASDVVYAEDIDIKWGGLETPQAEIDAALKKMLPKLHALFHKGNSTEAGHKPPSIIEKIRMSKQSKPQAEHQKSGAKKHSKGGPEH